MTDLADVILDMLHSFEETHGRSPDQDEVHVIRCDSMIIIEAEAAQELEARQFSPAGAKIDRWNEA